MKAQRAVAPRLNDTVKPEHVQPDYRYLIRSWERRTSLLRRISARLGLQGKLLLCFMALLSAALGGSCYLFVHKSSERLADLMGEQARQISYALSLAGKPALAEGRIDELQQIGQDLLKSRNILFVAFLDTQANTLAVASRDPDFRGTGFSAQNSITQNLMQVRCETGGVFGDHMEIIAPVLSLPGLTPPERSETGHRVAGARLLGYVSLGISQTREQEQLQQIAYYVVGIGFIIAIISLPLAYTLVYRVFQPIRQLVEATLKIAAGDLDTEVAIDRPDIIGTLARSFNEMVERVRTQQEALEEANTQLAYANAQLEEVNRGLEENVRQRTAQLEAANKRLSSEIAEKEDFLRAVSHDLNAPLRNISGMASMLLMKHRQKFDEDIIHRLERIQKNVEVETDLITELLELSRIKTRRQKMEPVEIDAMVRELGEMFDSDLKTKQIDFTIDSPLPVLHCEQARLRQVFQNLIDNAIKYMGDGKVREIHVGCMLKSSEAEFYVRDTGMGIDPEDISKVFFVFRRGKNGAAHNVVGKGVGLASVKSIIENYQGSIWVESQLGQGTTFRFSINGMYVPRQRWPRS